METIAFCQLVILWVVMVVVRTGSGQSQEEEAHDRQLRRRLLQSLGIGDSAEGGGGAADSTPVPAYVLALYGLADAAASRQDPGLPWLTQPKTVLAIRPSHIGQNNTKRVLEFSFPLDKTGGNLTGAELILPMQDARNLGLRRTTVICTSGLPCRRMRGSKRRSSQKAFGPWHVYDVSEAYTRVVQSVQDKGVQLVLSLRQTRKRKFKKTQIFKTADAPVLVLYSDFPGSEVLSGAFRKGKRRPKVKPAENTKHNTRSKREDRSLCQLKIWEVNTSSMGWQDIIKHPSIIQVNYCAGSCPEPLDSRAINTTNHAYVKSMYRTLYTGVNLPPACCVPIRFSTVHIIFITDIGSTALKGMYETRAVNCGCL